MRISGTAITGVVGVVVGAVGGALTTALLWPNHREYEVESPYIRRFLQAVIDGDADAVWANAGDEYHQSNSLEEVRLSMAAQGLTGSNPEAELEFLLSTPLLRGRRLHSYHVITPDEIGLLHLIADVEGKFIGYADI